MTRVKYLNDKDSWILAEEIPDMDLYFSQIWLSCFVDEFDKPSGMRYKKILSIYRGYHQWFYFGDKDSYEVGENIVDKFIENPEFAHKVNEMIVKTADDLSRFCKKIPEGNLDRLSNKKIWGIFEKQDKLHTHYYQWGWLPVAADMFHANFTERLKDHLQKIGVGKDNVNEVLVLLTQPRKKSLIQKEHEEFMELAVKINRDKYHKKLFRDLYKNFKERDMVKYGLNVHGPEYERMFEERAGEIIDKIRKPALRMIQRHYRKYFYINHLWVGKCYTFDHYIKEMAKLIGYGTDLRKSLDSERRDKKDVLIKRQKLMRKLGIQGQWKKVFDEWGDFMVTKVYRRFAQIYALYKMEFILREIGRRLGLSLKQVRFMLPMEVKEGLLNNKVKSEKLQERTKFCVYYAEKGIDRIYTGKRAKELAKKAESKKIRKVSELQGQCGCVGKVRGRVKIIIRPEDMGKMNMGDILVSIATDPDIVPAMKKAAGIVTEQGGVTSHAAIVSREMGIPCLIGTKVVTKVFKDGDKVEVDATKGIVKKL